MVVAVLHDDASQLSGSHVGLCAIDAAHNDSAMSPTSFMANENYVKVPHSTVGGRMFRSALRSELF
jgi:hypothetical protein